ncbi:glycerate kinase type-2 family protein [Falsirhodobacter deserti]|uniref:glycerate kinase type-2 family protein n=1 Tax=Falsirhodobacter deserti TaxID=1365611 RepID=UPI000FE3A65D|nr:glycerate kinase [Falsirhodobacter deserti]
MDETNARQLLIDMFHAAVRSADPLQVLAQHLPEKPKGRVVVVGAGKASASMARAVELAWPDVDLGGVVVTRYGHAVPTDRIEVIEASHPVPDAQNERAAGRILGAVRSAGPDDLVLALISGGGSSLMTMPAPGITLQDKIEVNRLLLASGLPISMMNQVRRRLSGIKGGKLAAAAPARVVTLAISDVPGDDPQTIASGPTIFDPLADVDLSDVVKALGDQLPAAARTLLEARPQKIPPFAADYRLIATPMMALAAAARVAEQAGIHPLILGDALEGEAREMGRTMAGIARSCLTHGLPHPAPVVLLSGGETTVTLRADASGRGGRNTEFALAMARALEGMEGGFALAADTDGIDGTEDAAGAIVTPSTLTRAIAAGLDPSDALRRNDSYSFFQAVGDLVQTGPTLTNVNDFRAVLVL